MNQEKEVNYPAWKLSKQKTLSWTTINLED